MCAHDQSSIFSIGGKFRPDYGLLLELHALTLVARSYVFLVSYITKYTNIADPGTQIYKRDKQFKVWSLLASLKHYIQKEIFLHQLITLKLSNGNMKHARKLHGQNMKYAQLCTVQAKKLTCTFLITSRKVDHFLL